MKHSIEEEVIIKLFDESNETGKAILRKELGDKLFVSALHRQILEACKEHGFDPNELPYPNPSDKEQESDNADKILKVITKSVNKGHIFDWKNGSERKWFPVFDMNPSDGSGFGFSGSLFGHSHSYSYVGPRRSFVSEKLSDETAKKYLLIYKAALTQ